MPSEMEKPQNGFTGVNIRTDRAHLKEDSLTTRAVNVDFNKEIGTASIRNGRYTLDDLDPSDLVVRLIAKVNSKRYYVADNHLYRDETQLNLHPAELDSGLESDMEAFRPLSDTHIWAFLGDIGSRERLDDEGRGHSAMKKDNGTVTRKWGIAPPPAYSGTVIPPSEGTNSGTIYLTHIRFDTDNEDNPSAVAHEGNPTSLSVSSSN